MNQRLEHIQKAQSAISQVVANLQAIGELGEHDWSGPMAEAVCKIETRLLEMEDAEPIGDPDPHLTTLEGVE